MSAEVLPYTVKPHPVTGLYNGKFGIWLFLASEVMLFGALFSTYVFLRMGAPETGPTAWPTGEETHLNWMLGGLNTLILILSSVTMVLAWVQFKMDNFAKGRIYLIITAILAIAFVAIKFKFEYAHKFHMDIYPKTSVFFAIYYTMTGLHAIHIIGGVVVICYFIGPGAKLWEENREYYTNRIECTGLYWHFVDLVWIFLFPILYLL